MARKTVPFAAVVSFAVAAAAGGQEPDKYAQGRLSWSLHRLASEAERGAPLRAAGRRFVDERGGRVTAVAELVEHADAGELAALVTELGGRVEAVAEQVGWVKLSLAPGALRRAAEHPSVARLRTPYYPNAKEVVSEGVAAVQLSELVARTGADGSGVTVAVIDRGFMGVAELIGTELPADTELGAFTAEHLDSFDSAHGTACAEIIHDLAPKARLRLLGFEDGVTYFDALNAVPGAAVVSHSLGFDNLYPIDGASPFSVNVNLMQVFNGALFVTAAGNEAERYYQGSWADADANDVMEFDARTELLPVGVFAGGSRVILRWDDLHGSSGHDYDLYIVRREFADNPVFEDNPAIVTSSLDLQAGAGNPLEIVDIQVEEDQVLYAVIRRDPASPPAPEQRFWLWSEGTVHPDYRSSEGTLAIPADARGSLAVGAVNVDGLTLEPFSSRGPTDDGRVKPDLVAPDGVSTASFGPSGFFGTSAATPHVAAAAALIVSLHPGVVGEPLLRAVERATATGGVEDEKNNEVGFGLLDLTKAR
jgi:subtilisin family serine protease